MSWIINISFLLLLTCLTGSICMAVWLAAAILLQRRGNAQIIYRLLKLVMWGYTMPLVYLAFYGWNRFLTSEGWVLITTPRMDMVLRICFILWIAGIVVYAVIQLPMIWQFKKIRRDRIYGTVHMTMLMDRLKKELGIRKNIVLYQGYMVISPFICGFRRTEIYLPVKPMNDKELEVVLRHELIHYKQRDTSWKPAFAVINGLFWFNPLVWYVSRKMQRWAEASCDEACCKGGRSAKEYFGIIMNMVTSDAWRPGTYSPLWAEGESELIWRVRCMIKNQKNKRGKSWVAVMAAAAMMIGSCMSVYAATVSVGGLYDEIYRQTQENDKETLLDDGVIEHTGMVDELFEGLTIEETPGMRSTSMNWTVGSRVVKKTAYFSRKSGETIDVAGIITPKDVTVQVGIIEPDNHGRYIDAKGAYSHTFKLTKTGSYKVYVENLTSTSVTVKGYYD